MLSEGHRGRLGMVTDLFSQWNRDDDLGCIAPFFDAHPCRPLLLVGADGRDVSSKWIGEDEIVKWSCASSRWTCMTRRTTRPSRVRCGTP